MNPSKFRPLGTLVLPPSLLFVTNNNDNASTSDLTERLANGRVVAMAVGM